MADEIQGWKPPIIYDISIDSYRIVTQQDIDHLCAVERAYGALRMQFKQFDIIHQNLLLQLEKKDG